MPESLESHAYRKIKNDIVNAALSPGLLLSENELSMHLGISRTPVHNAISRLEKEGFLESLPKRGFMVKDITVDEFFDMHETIVSMECYSLARLEDTGALDMRELKRNLEAQVAALEAGDNFAYYGAGFDFAATILASSGNKVMLDVLSQFRDKIFCKVLNYRKAHPEYKPKLSRNRNEKVYEALVRGDIPGAHAELLHTMAYVRVFLQAWA